MSLVENFNMSEEPLKTRTFPSSKMRGGSECVRRALGIGEGTSGGSEFAFGVFASGKGAEASFTARAIGDLDCDGVHSTFELVGRVDGQGRAEIAPGIWEMNAGD